jgi:hypothetical protein
MCLLSDFQQHRHINVPRLRTTPVLKVDFEMKMLMDHGRNNTEKRCQNTRRKGPSVTFWTTDLTWSDHWSSPGRSVTTYDLTLGTECDSILLSNVPRHSADLCSTAPPVKSGFWRENCYGFLVPGSWHWQGWPKYSVKKIVPGPPCPSQTRFWTRAAR